jgi:hypothetical protein
VIRKAPTARRDETAEVITILVVGALEEDIALAGGDPSVEILLARGAEEAVEKLSRNRRIDAILLAPTLCAEAAPMIRREDPASPPLFVAGGPPAAGAIWLPAGERLLPKLLAHLAGQGEEQ